MKNVFIALTLTLSACGSDGKNGADGKKGTAGEQGVAGKAGEAGEAGKNGEAGESTAQVLATAIQTIQANQSSILDIQCVSNGSRGSGVKLRDGRILTAYHVVEGCTSVQYYDGNTLVGTGGTVFRDGARDVARISNVAWSTAGLALRGYPEVNTYNPKVGDLTVTAGFPLDLVNDVQLTVGLVTDANFTNGTNWTTAMITDAAAAGGSSGSPVFNSKGELIAIHVGGYNTGGLELSYQLVLR